MSCFLMFGLIVDSTKCLSLGWFTMSNCVALIPSDTGNICAVGLMVAVTMLCNFQTTSMHSSRVFAIYLIDKGRVRQDL